MTKLFALILALAASLAAAADPLPKEDVPPPLRGWIPWAMHGHETVACPPAHDDGEQRACVWPTELTLDLSASHGSFDYRVEIVAAAGWVVLPGDAEHWPLDVRGNAGPIAVVERDERPQVRLPAGVHQLRGRFAWPELPQSLALPPAVAIVHARVDGKAVPGQAGDDGLLWLQQTGTAPTADALTKQVYRLVDDDIPMKVTTMFDLVVAGRAREVTLPTAVPDGFVPLSIDSPLPARLTGDGQLRVQLRPGNWQLTVASRRSQPVDTVEVAKGGDWPEEIWVVRSHADLHRRTVSGGQSIDPKQTAMSQAWKGLPAYRLALGESLRFVPEVPNEAHAEDRLTLDRQAWLDFDGGGFTFQDRLLGELTRSWRLEAAPGIVLGRIAVDGEDQPITRLAADAGAGIELRRGKADISADSRQEGGVGTLAAASWNADFSALRISLHLPPGWRLLHATGADRTLGSWVSRWDLWALFFVLLSTLACAKLFDIRAGVVCGLALLLSWQLDEAPQLLWPGLLGLVALLRVLPTGRIHRVVALGRIIVQAVILVMLLGLAITLTRQSIYPSLEQAGGHAAQARLPVAPASAPAEVVPMQDEAKAERGKYAVLEPQTLSSSSLAGKRTGVDPRARVQTGPGLPSWHWHQYALSWQGPVPRGAQAELWLLSPAVMAVINLVTIVSLAYLFWIAAGRWKPGRSWWSVPGAQAAAPLIAVAMITCGPNDVWAAEPAGTSASGDEFPSPTRLDELRRYLTEAPDCLPACADLAQLQVFADAASIRLRLQIHAQTPVMVPLPGQRGQFVAERIQMDGKSATLRRDESGLLWVSVAKGVHDVEMEASSSADNVQVTLPMPPRQVRATVVGWVLGGLDAQGNAGDALTLVRKSRGSTAAQHGDAALLPPFVRVTRTLSLTDRWRLTTTISREGPSPAPLEVRVPLLAGEAVTNAEVRVDNGVAVVVLGQAADAVFHSSLAEADTLTYRASTAAHQIETWRVEADARWHFEYQGLEPVSRRTADGLLTPEWRPWPGESMTLAVSRPKGVDGQTLTVDSLTLSFNPGQRATDVAARLSLRSSQGRNHQLQLPAGATLQRLVIDDQVVPASGNSVTLAIPPGAHRVNLEWREDRGMAGLFSTSGLNLAAQGVNVEVDLQVPADRVVLAVGGPSLGPAVLFWGALLVVIAMAWLLGRLRFAPLGFVAWLLLGVGLLQSSPIAVATVVAWFGGLSLRQRHAQRLHGRWFKAVQIALLFLSLLAAVALLAAVHAGLLGYPDMMIEGNGSSGHRLVWYADRLADIAPQAWVLSIPLWIYRVAMLAWALWLARALLGWLQWGWAAYTQGGAWPASDPRPRRRWFRRGAQSESDERAAEATDVPPTDAA